MLKIKIHKNTVKEDQTHERFKEAQGRNGKGGSKIVFMHRNCLRSWSALFPKHPDYVLERISCYRRCDLGEKYLDNINAVFDLNHMIRDSSSAYISVI